MNYTTRLKISKVILQTILEAVLLFGAYTMWLDNISFLSATVITICVLLSFFLNGKCNLKLKINKVMFIWLAYILGIFINVYFSSDVAHSFSFAKPLSVMILMSIAYSTLQSNTKIIGYLMILLSFIVTVSIFVEYLNYGLFRNIAKSLFSDDSYIIISSLRGSFNRYVGLGVYAGPASCLIIYGICAALVYMKKNMLFYLMIFFDIIAIFLTGSKTLLLIFTFIWLAYYARMRAKEEKILTKKRILVNLLIGVIICLIGAIAFGSINGSQINSLRIISGGDAVSSIFARLKLYLFALELFVSAPLFGVGLNTFLNYSILNQSIESTYTHNLFLQTLAEQGIVGAVLLFTAMTISFICIFYKFKNNKNILAYKLSILLQVVFFIYSLVGNPFYDVNLRMIYFMSLYMGVRNDMNKKVGENYE